MTLLSLGILLALFCAFATNVGFLLKHRGACAAPDVSLKRPLASAVGLFRSKWFALGMLVALGAWVFHVAALAMAPLSIVQAVIAGGLVFLAVTLPTHGGGSSYSTAAMIAFESALLALGTFLVLSKKLDSHEHHGVMLGTAAGILFGVSDVAIKALTTSMGDGMVGILSPWLVTCIAASVIAFYASARGLQKGEAVPVITLTSAAANVTAISGGILVFGDPMPNDTIGIVIQSFAFVLVIVAAALTPAPLRAARASS